MEEDIQEIKIVCFRLGRDSYALDIMRVKEIIKPLDLAGLPNAPDFVTGVINLRGSIIPVVDLRKRFGVSESATGKDTRFLIAVIDRQPVGLRVDSVNEVATIPIRDLRPVPSVVKVPGYRYLIGVCLVREAMVMLVNPDSILDNHERAELSGFRASVEGT